MAEEKLGTLQYDMLVNQKKLDDQLEDITKKLQEKDKQWKDILSGQGNVITPKINVTDLGNLTKANEAIAVANNAVAKSTDAIKSKISELRTELKKNITAYEDMDAAARQTSGASKLADIQSQKDQLVELGEAYRQATTDKREAVKAESYWNKVGKDEVTAQMELNKKASDQRAAQINKEIQDQKKFEQQAKNAGTKQAFEDYERLKKASDQRVEQLRKEALALGKIAEAYRQSKDPIQKLDLSTQYKQKQLQYTEDPAQIKELNRQILANNEARKKLVITQREQEASTRRLWQEQKLKIAVDNQAAGSIERLRAQYALLKFQLSQVKFSDPNAVASVQKLQTAIAGVKAEIQALQPTLGIWGKLTSAIRTYATAYLSVQAVLGLGRAIYGQTKELDSLDFSMKTVIKSSTELAQTQKFLSEVAVNYGGDLLTLSERYVRFRAAAVQSNLAASDTQKIFESVSKASGVVGLRTDQLSNAYLALEQMISKGKITTEELRRQLGDVLPGSFGIMANALGVTIPELDKMLKKGEVLSTVALPKFAAALEKAYGIESLKKIDTLAAAQGRLSTEFTGLIKGLQASDTFKGAINGVASFLGFIKDNIGAITILSKALVGLIITNATYKAILTASVPIQRTLLLLTGNQTAALTQLSFAQKRVIAGQAAAIAGTTMWARAWNALKITFLSNPLGVILTGLTLIGTALYAISGRTKEAQRGIVSFADNLSKEKSKLDQLFNSLQKAGKSTYEYKDALFQINNLYGKYLPNLLTEKSNIDEVTKARILANKSLEEEMMLRERSSRLEAASAKKDQVMSEIMADILAASPSITAEKKGLIFARIMDIANIGELDPEKRKVLISKAFKGDLSAIEEYVSKATYALEGYKAKVASIDAFFSARESKKVDLFDPEIIEKAKKDFEEYSKLQSQGAGQLMISPFIDKDNQTLRQWLENQIKLYKGNEDALRSLYLAMAELDKNQNSSASRLAKIAEDRAEAIKKLNDKYLADQEDFANYEMGIQATRIANMEDGLDKEIKLNELAYEKRIAAIEKEKIARLNLLNEAAGIRTGAANEITSFDATGYSPEITELIRKANENDLQSRKNAENDLRESNLKSEKDYQIKINEIRRDANDQFLSGIQKEKAAINEKYDEWVRKATTNKKLVDEIESSRRVAISEVDRQNAIDRLDFEREIEYKKNEIRLKGNDQSEKLNRANFETYYKYELKRGKLLLQSVNIDKQQEGRDVLNKLLQDVTLNNLDKEAELRKQILAYADDLFESLSKVLGLTEQEAKALKGSFDALKKAASGDIVGGAVEATMNLFNIVLDSYTQGKEKRDAFYESAIAQQKDYNLLLNEQLRLSSEIDGTLFFTNIKDKIASSVSALKDANENYIEAFSKLSDASAIVGTKKVVDWANVAAGSVTGIFGALVGLFGGKKTVNVLAPLLETYPELLDANNKFNISLAESLIKNNQLEESSAKIVQNVIDWAKAAEEAKKQLDGVITDLVGSLGSDLETSLVSAFTEGTDSAIAFGDAVGNVIDNIIKKMIFQTVFGAGLKKLQTDMYASMGLQADGTTPIEGQPKKPDGTELIDFSWIDDLKKYNQENKDKTAEFNRLMEEAKAAGYLQQAAATTSSGISKGIQALTEDTGRRLEGLINSIRETSVMNMGNTKQLVESSQMIQGYAAQSLGHLRNIDATTAAQLTLFNEIMTSTNGTGGKGIKVYVQ